MHEVYSAVVDVYCVISLVILMLYWYELPKQIWLWGCGNKELDWILNEETE